MPLNTRHLLLQAIADDGPSPDHCEAFLTLVAENPVLRMVLAQSRCIPPPNHGAAPPVSFYLQTLASETLGPVATRALATGEAIAQLLERVPQDLREYTQQVLVRNMLEMGTHALEDRDDLESVVVLTAVASCALGGKTPNEEFMSGVLATIDPARLMEFFDHPPPLWDSVVAIELMSQSPQASNLGNYFASMFEKCSVPVQIDLLMAMHRQDGKMLRFLVPIHELVDSRGGFAQSLSAIAAKSPHEVAMTLHLHRFNQDAVVRQLAVDALGADVSPQEALISDEVWAIRLLSRLVVLNSLRGSARTALASIFIELGASSDILLETQSLMRAIWARHKASVARFALNLMGSPSKVIRCAGQSLAELSSVPPTDLMEAAVTTADYRALTQLIVMGTEHPQYRVVAELLPLDRISPLLEYILRFEGSPPLEFLSSTLKSLPIVDQIRLAELGISHIDPGVVAWSLGTLAGLKHSGSPSLRNSALMAAKNFYIFPDTNEIVEQSIRILARDASAEEFQDLLPLFSVQYPGIQAMMNTLVSLRPRIALHVFTDQLMFSQGTEPYPWSVFPERFQTLLGGLSFNEIGDNLENNMMRITPQYVELLKVCPPDQCMLAVSLKYHQRLRSERDRAVLRRSRINPETSSTPIGVLPPTSQASNPARVDLLGDDFVAALEQAAATTSSQPTPPSVPEPTAQYPESMRFPTAEIVFLEQLLAHFQIRTDELVALPDLELDTLVDIYLERGGQHSGTLLRLLKAYGVTALARVEKKIEHTHQLESLDALWWLHDQLGRSQVVETSHGSISM